MTLSKWLRQAAIDDGERPGATTVESAQNRELYRRVRLLEREVDSARKAATLNFGGSFTTAVCLVVGTD